MPDLEEQPVPERSRCPDCGGEPREDDVLHRLSSLGYMHDDIGLVCSECGNQWTCGVPIGDFERAEIAGEMRCDSCENSTMLVHRVDTRGLNAPGDIDLHLKCPAPDCNYFTIVGRDTDDDGRALVGYDLITGSVDGAEPYGWIKED